mgnify:CR=1 FL=1
MSNKSDAIAALEGAHEKLLQAGDDIPDDKMTAIWYGEWSVHDILAHVAGWYGELTGVFQRIARGEPPAPEGVDYNDLDGWNARFVKARQADSARDVIAELESGKRAFVAALSALPEDRFADGRTAQRIVHNFVNGEGGHAADIRAWRQQQGI